MAFYLVENDDACINNWGSYWIVEADNAKEAIHRAYVDGNELYAIGYGQKVLARGAKETGIFKRKLTAYRIDELVKNDPNHAYMIT